MGWRSAKDDEIAPSCCCANGLAPLSPEAAHPERLRNTACCPGDGEAPAAPRQGPSADYRQALGPATGSALSSRARKLNLRRS